MWNRKHASTALLALCFAAATLMIAPTHRFAWPGRATVGVTGGSLIVGAGEAPGPSGAGVGAPPKVEQHADQLILDHDFAFGSNTSTKLEVPLDSNWNATRVGVNVTRLSDSRDWVNGTLSYGGDDGDNSTQDDDTGWHGLDWTFFKWDDYGWTDGFWFNWHHNISGNYNSSTSAVGRDSLELLIEGYEFDPNNWPGCYNYGYHDYAQWSQAFDVPRGEVKNATLRFSANPWHTTDLNLWELRFLLDGVLFHSVGVYSLSQACGGQRQWGEFEVPLSRWTNTTDVFSGNLDSSTHNLSVRLEFINNNSWWNDPNADYQQVFVSGVDLILEADVKPEQVGLQVNGAIPNGGDYGEASVTLTKELDGGSALNLSRQAGDYDLYGRLDARFEAKMSVNNACWEPNQESTGAKYEVDETQVSWEWWVHVVVPAGWSLKRVAVEAPGDWTFSGVFSPQQPLKDWLGICSVARPGLLEVPVAAISGVPDGWWRFAAQSPNYVENLVVSPSTLATNQVPAATFHLLAAGNFTSIGGTVAKLEIFYPNGTLAAESNVPVGSDPGVSTNASFFSVERPEGDYALSIQWSNEPANETGWATAPLRLVHGSILEAPTPRVEGLPANGSATIKVTWTDEDDGTPVEGGLVTYEGPGNSTGQFAEYSAGVYVADFTAPAASPGDAPFVVNLTVTARHQYHATATVVVQVEVLPPPAVASVALVEGLVAAAAAMASGFVAYQTRFKHPRKVRAIRKAAKAIGTKKSAKVKVKAGGLAEEPSALFRKAHEKAKREISREREAWKFNANGKAATSSSRRTREVGAGPAASVAPVVAVVAPASHSSLVAVPPDEKRLLKTKIVRAEEIKRATRDLDELRVQVASLEADLRKTGSLDLVSLEAELEKKLARQQAALEGHLERNRHLREVEEQAAGLTELERRREELARHLAGGRVELERDLRKKLERLVARLESLRGEQARLEAELERRGAADGAVGAGARGNGGGRE
ncbi:MAG: hypothetical protein Kow0069_29880 [Promethearchaeota archaeon]